MNKQSTASINRDGNLTINGSFNFEGPLIELKKLIDDTINEYGEDTTCKLSTFGSFPHRWSSHIILTNKKNEPKIHCQEAIQRRLCPIRNGNEGDSCETCIYVD